MHLAVVTLALTTACTIEAPPPAGPGDPGAKLAISAREALGAFDQICGSTLPNFRHASERLGQAGFRPSATTAAFQDTTRALSFTIVEGPGPGASCGMAFASPDDATEIARVFSRIGQFGPTDLGTAALYRGTAALVFLNSPVTQGDHTLVNIRMFSER